MLCYTACVGGPKIRFSDPYRQGGALGEYAPPQISKM